MGGGQLVFASRPRIGRFAPPANVEGLGGVELRDPRVRIKSRQEEVGLVPRPTLPASNSYFSGAVPCHAISFPFDEDRLADELVVEVAKECRLLSRRSAADRVLENGNPPPSYRRTS